MEAHKHSWGNAMTNALIADLEAIVAKVKNAFGTELSALEQDAIALEQKLAPGFKALIQKIVSTIGAQGVTILEQGLTDIVTVIESGGNVGAALAALIPQVTAQVSADLKQDANTAAHGAVELLISTLPVPVAANSAPVEQANTLSPVANPA